MAEPSSPPQPLPATPDALARVLERRPVLWIGAGLSIAAGYPSARQVVEAMTAEADDPLDTSRPFLAIADAFVASVGKGQAADLISRLFRTPRAPTASHRALARLTLADGGAGRFHAVITASADALAEHADYDNYGDKDGLRTALVREQGGLCCYCMGRIEATREKAPPASASA